MGVPCGERRGGRRNLSKEVKKGENRRKSKNLPVEKDINSRGLVQKGIERTEQKAPFRYRRILATIDGPPLQESEWPDP